MQNTSEKYISNSSYSSSKSTWHFHKFIIFPKDLNKEKFCHINWNSNWDAGIKVCKIITLIHQTILEKLIKNIKFKLIYFLKKVGII